MKRNEPVFPRYLPALSGQQRKAEPCWLHYTLGAAPSPSPLPLPHLFSGAGQGHRLHRLKIVLQAKAAQSTQATPSLKLSATCWCTANITVNCHFLRAIPYTLLPPSLPDTSPFNTYFSFTFRFRAAHFHILPPHAPHYNLIHNVIAVGGRRAGRRRKR